MVLACMPKSEDAYLSVKAIPPDGTLAVHRATSGQRQVVDPAEGHKVVLH